MSESDVLRSRLWAIWAVGLVAYVVGVMQRTSLGVAGLDAAARFHASPAELSGFVVLQLLVYAAILLGLPVRDLTGGFKCFRAEVLEAIDLPSVQAHGYAFQVELTNRTIRRGFTVVEVPITFRDRLRGKSKMSARIAVEAMVLVPRLRRRDR